MDKLWVLRGMKVLLFDPCCSCRMLAGLAVFRLVVRQMGEGFFGGGGGLLMSDRRWGGWVDRLTQATFPQGLY